MKPLTNLRMSWRAIRSHKLRSTLTTLGVVIGVAAVITFVTLGASLQAGIIGDISPDDRQNIYGWAAPEESSNQGPLAGAQPVFTQADVDGLSEQPGVRAAYGYTSIPTQSVGFGGERIPRQDAVVATGVEYVDEDEIADGRRFEYGQREAVLNPAMANAFERNVTVGDTITVTVVGGFAVNATVVGITTDSEARSPFEGFGPGPRVYLPLDPYYTQLVAEAQETPRFPAIVVEAESIEGVDRAKESTRSYLETDSDAQEQAEAANLTYELQTSTELLGQLQAVLDQLQAFVVGIAALSLLVGSIGIANIMLVSVTERTREIGIMKAVGAQRRDILTLFVTEAVIVGIIGSILGTLLGILGGWAGAQYIDIPLTYPVEWFAIAIAVGILVGVGAGLYPAWRGARTDPIDALRYE
ncbi:ABC transporter permease [Haloarchaeobius iranensis]|uniref:Putative ABC transport system permease protein n=1 Tax=Haloarchaeobius iranensis TaxID=996166 RepID=A0A1G9SGQ8_9EURY|nr:ABC transporter permease [Haloarchaeobius iranensis]SDM34582.1 putative ABC transport system permease protein [Haloarchaeobius iranensis]